jgi:hypothetical protein
VTAGFRADLPPGLQVPLQQWHAKVTADGVLGLDTPRLRLLGIDDAPEPAEHADMCVQTRIAWTLITSLVIVLLSRR